VQKKPSILPIFFTVFLDLVGVGIIIPVMAPLLLDPSHHILAADTSQNTRTLILGIILAMYPLAQFFGAPILGALSDRYGRKKLLLISLCGTMIGYFIFAAGIYSSALLLLFLARILDGFTGGNISIAMSAIADISDPQEKAKNFGLIGMAFGVGFVIGPFIGGKLADPTVVSWFNYSTPFLFAALLSAINILLVIFRFKETLTTRKMSQVSLLTGMRNIKKALQMPRLRTMFAVVFLLTFGFNFFTQFFQVFLIQKFAYTQSQIGDLFAYVGLWIAFTQGFILRKLPKTFTPVRILSFSALLLGYTLPLLLIPDKAIYLYLILPFIAMFNGLTQPNSQAIVSSLTDASSQGEILGINQSFQSLAMTIPPIIAGLIVNVDRNLPILVAGTSTVLAWLIFVSVFRKKAAQSV
jgi:DHA1 family tetracycline resistance protein-like MFS transporter